MTNFPWLKRQDNITCFSIPKLDFPIIWCQESQTVSLEDKISNWFWMAHVSYSCRLSMGSCILSLTWYSSYFKAITEDNVKPPLQISIYDYHRERNWRVISNVEFSYNHKIPLNINLWNVLCNLQKKVASDSHDHNHLGQSPSLTTINVSVHVHSYEQRVSAHANLTQAMKCKS